LYGFTNGAAIQPAPAGAEGAENGQIQTPYDLTGSEFLGGLVGKTKIAHDIKLSGQVYYFKPLNSPGHQQLGTDNVLEIPLTSAFSVTLRAYATTSPHQAHFFETKNLIIATGFSVSF